MKNTIKSFGIAIVIMAIGFAALSLAACPNPAGGGGGGNSGGGTTPSTVTLKTVTFNSNDGSAIAAQTIKHGGKATKPADPSKSGYNSKFANWYKEVAFANLWDFANDTVTDNITLYAKWDAYSIGDTGPGGGKIFYRIEAGFTHYQTATDTAGITAYYLEAAPANMATTLAWASSGYTATDITGTETAIGTGRKNTALILATDANAPAVKACKDLTNGGKTDWFFPSKDELNQLYVNRNAVNNVEGNYYWSSSQSYDWSAWGQDFGSGSQYNGNGSKSTNYGVRAVRAF